MNERKEKQSETPKINGPNPAIPERKPEGAKKHIRRSGKKPKRSRKR